jgi:DNA repair protein RadD
MVLRDYQARAVERGVAFLRRPRGGGGGLIVLPTGAGKSFVIASIVQQLDAPCLIFQPSKEILEQNATKLLAYGYTPAIYSVSMGTKEVGAITLATIGSVRESPHLFDECPYVMVDEAHLVNAKAGMYKDFLAALGDVRLIGLTATPYRLTVDGYGGAMLKFLTRTRPRVFTEVVAYAQVPDLIAQGYLVRPTYQIVSGFTGAHVPRNSTGADYDEGALRREFNRIGFPDRVRRVVDRLLTIGRRRVLVFTRFVEDAEALVAACPGAAVVSADTPPKLREAIVSGFRTGEIPVVANVGVLGIGFDYPELDTVVLARPTLSLALYYQQVGRVLRPHPDKTAWVVDLVDQVRQFGPVEDLWLQPGGVTGEKWEMVSRSTTPARVLTNTYFGPPSRFHRKRRRVIQPKW